MKRFTDTEKWNDPWFRRLAPPHKLFWQFICDKCDNAGVWKVDLELASFVIGGELESVEILQSFDGRIEEIAPRKWLVINFVKFQYDKLSLQSRPHGQVLRTIRDHGLNSFFDELIVERSDTVGAYRKRLTQSAKDGIFHRDDYRCQFCGGDSKSQLRVDHINPLIKGGTNEDANLVTSCISCNSRKSDLDIREFIKRHKIIPLESLSKLLNSQLRVPDTLKDKEKDKEKSQEREGETEGKPVLLRLRKLFGKRETTALDASEQKAWRSAERMVEQTPEEDWALIEWAYQQSNGLANQFRRKDMATLLNNWNCEIDRAKTWKNGNGQNSQNGSKTDRQMSAFEIEKRSKAIGEEINRVFRKNDNKRVEGDGIDELKNRRNELQRQLVT